MGFWTTFGKAWSDYKGNFVTIIIFMGIFNFIPAIAYSNLVNGAVASGDFNWAAIPLLFFVGLIYFFMSSFAYISLTFVSLKQSRFTLRQVSSVGRSVYWKALGFGVVLCLFLTGLFILLFVPGIIFFIYWIFGIYVFLDSGKKGILQALSDSKKLVKGRWWRTFGNMFLLVLLGLVALAIVSMFYLVSEFVGTFAYQLFNSLLMAPFTILFLKHFYLEYKKKR